VEDLGKPSSYLMLEPGPPVYSCDGEEVGKVEHVLADHADDIFDGIVLDATVLPGGQRFVDAQHVEEIYERGVILKIDRAAAEALPKPSANAAAMEVTADDVSDRDSAELRRKLGRAWDLISGK
jgi:uncharacterized protein YrrD